MVIFFGFLGGVALTTIFFLIRELRSKQKFEKMWDEIFNFEDKVMEDVNYINGVVADEHDAQWNSIHDQWSHINEFEDRLLKVLDDDLDETDVDYVKNNTEHTKKVDDATYMDEILIKISQKGMNSLSPEELNFLNKMKK